MSEQKHVVMDATLLASLQVCERKLELRHGLNVVPNTGKSKALEMGSLVHVILEHFYKSIRDNKKNESISIGLAAGEHYFKYGELISKPEEPEIYDPLSAMQIDDYALILDTIDKYFSHYKNDSFTPVEIEHVKGEVIYEDSDIKLLWKAKFDLIGDFPNGFMAVDHKTMKQRRDTLILNNQFMGQNVLLGTRTMLINKVGFQTSLKMEERFQRVPINYSSDQLSEFISIAAYYAKYLVALTENNYFPPRYTQCETKFGKCEYYENYCSVNQNMREENLKLFFKAGKYWDISNEGE